MPGVDRRRWLRGSGPEQLILAAGWRERCRPVALEAMRFLTVSVLAPVDLVLTKLARGDEGDLEDIRFLLETGQVQRAEIEEVLPRAVVPEILAEAFAAARGRLLGLLAGSAPTR